MKTEELGPLQGKRLLLAISGSIAAVKTPTLVSNLVKAGANVRCVVTPSAARLVSAVSLSTLSRNRCFQEEDQWDPKEARPLHIELAEWCDLIIVAPLTSSSLARWVHGLSDGLLASILIASEKPVIAAAAMNTGMWSNQAVQTNWQKLLENKNVICLEPASGLLACDRNGQGKMADTDLIELAIESTLIQTSKTGAICKDWKEKKFLVTAGATLEPLDAARNMTNRSSGRMGVLLAQAARFRGGKVDLIHGKLQTPKGWIEGLSSYSITNAKEMEEVISKLQPNANAIAMTAAITDFRRYGEKSLDKLDKKSFLSKIQQNLEEVPDLLQKIISQRSRDQVVLGFSALTGNDNQIKKLGEAKRKKKGCDLLLANPIDRPNQGFDTDFNGGWLLRKEGMASEIPVQNKLAMAHLLLDEILELLVD